MLRYNKFQKYIVLDFETEGLNLVYTKPWQLSWIECTLDGITKEHDYFLKWPDLNMSEGAKKITNFSDEKYNRLAIDPAPILQLLDSQIYNPDVLIVGQNILGFDIYVHNVLRKKLGFKSDYSYLPRVLDTKCLSKAKNLEIACSGDRILWQMRMNSVNSKKAGKNSQGAMLKELGIPHDTTRLHDSLYDVQMTWKIYKKLINMVEI